ncbi:hypothetical protein VKT23_009030 [Stygiomarasmius scandens]|uniref:C-CAP/cofactor C-like domain-containing protein n=1 Tax=Marasmiellus scandens TaxID=2682957 RepID=A0ABR1JH45_9AGAR
MSADPKPLRDDPSKRWGFADVFLTQFQASRTELESRINALNESVSGTVSKDALDALTVDFEKISKSLREAIGLIPKTDQGSCEAQLKKLEKSIEDLRKSSAPKSKFAFKRKPKAETSGTATTTISSSSSTSTSTPEPQSVSSQDTSASTSISTSHLTLSSHSQEHLTLRSIAGLPSASDSSSPRLRSDLALTDLENCVVNLLTPPLEKELDISAVQIRNVKNCVVLLPKINGSVMLHDMKNCVVVLGCHQFRMHTSQAVDVCLDIRSNPIIEHCNGIRFGPYPTYDHSATLDTASGTNLSVQDFSHIKPTPSPNWTLLSNDDSEENRLGQIKGAILGSGEKGLPGILESLLPSQ